jgi:hypothetical protein
MSEDQATPQKASAPLTDKSDTKPAVVKVECPTPEMVIIAYDTNADESAMSATAITTLKEICSKACIGSVKVTSTARKAKDQARIMYDLIKANSPQFVKNLYAAPGKKIVETYEESVKNKLSADDTKTAMLSKIEEVGPSNVSHHVVSDDGKLCVFDVAPSSVGDSEAKKRFMKEMEAHASVVKSYKPPADPAYHLEVQNP